MRVLVACEHSGVVREAFAKKGHDAISCDLLPTDIPGKHYQGDVRHILNNEWDLIIAHPDCTYITNTGVCHLHSDTQRWFKLYEAIEFFNLFLNHPCPKICVENPIPHRYAKQGLQKNYTQLIQPYYFGHLEQKATCLWLKGLPKLVHTSNVKAEMMQLPKNIRQRLHYLPPSPDRWKLRSQTFQGIADAMADQWSEK